MTCMMCGKECPKLTFPPGEHIGKCDDCMGRHLDKLLVEPVRLPDPMDPTTISEVADRMLSK